MNDVADGRRIGAVAPPSLLIRRAGRVGQIEEAGD